MLLAPATKLLCLLGLGLGLLLGPAVAQAQTAPMPPVAPHGYDFLTVLAIESPYKKEPRVLVVPSFEGKAEIPLAPTDFYVGSSENLEAVKSNLAIINNLLQAITGAGWELISTAAIPVAGGTYRQAPTRYLFRRPRP